MALLTHLTAAPHRPLFLIGSIQAVAAMLFWLAVLEIPALPALAWPAAAGHAWSMLYGLFAPFVFGFLFTALPNWVNGAPIRRAEYLPTAGLMAAGNLSFYAGLWLPGLGTPALVLHLAGWAVGLAALLRILLTCPPGDNRQPWAAWLATLLGLFGDAAFLAWHLSGADGLLRLGEALGLWGFLTPLFLAVCHRMIPWFTDRVVTNYVMVRPYPALWVLFAASLGHGLAMALALPQWTWPADLVLAAVAFWFTARWGLRRGLAVPLLAMLHIAFAWAGLAFALSAADSLLRLAGQAGLGLAPLHALGIGFFASMLVGMASRVSLGHSGRKLECDRTTWRLFLALQAAALLRMLPDLLPAWFDFRLAGAAGLVWLVVFLLWAAKYAPFYWRPRADGKPG